jgi:hypothetical protein
LIEEYNIPEPDIRTTTFLTIFSQGRWIGEADEVMTR